MKKINYNIYYLAFPCISIDTKKKTVCYMATVEVKGLDSGYHFCIFCYPNLSHGRHKKKLLFGRSWDLLVKTFFLATQE